MKNRFLSMLLAGSVLSTGLVLAQETFAQEQTTQPQKSEVVYSRPKMDPQEMRKRMAKKMAKDLNLTEEQQKQAEKIRADGQEKINPLMKEMRKIRLEIDKIRKENMAEFEKILTPDQKTKFDQIKKDRPNMKRHDRPMMRGMHGKPFERGERSSDRGFDKGFERHPLPPADQKPMGEIIEVEEIDVMENN